MSAAVEDVSGKAFDYVIVGGGTAGLVVAARLSEDPSVNVTVLEAGHARFGDPLIDIPGQYGKHFGSDQYAWNFETTPQTYCNNIKYAWPRGKVLGGSSAINFYAWTKPPAADIDIWEKLGNPGWNWTNFDIYSKKCEAFTPPDKESEREYRHVYNPDAHGTTGPLKTSFPQFVIEPEVPFQQALLAAGIWMAKDPLNGDPIGTFMAPGTLDYDTSRRTHAGTAYYLPNAHRKNLQVLCGALVRCIAIGPIPFGGSVQAESVEFEYDGRIHHVYVGREVVLCAGALKSPQILELSGIGDERILATLGLRMTLNLPGVGSNLQEHIFTGIIFELDRKFNFETLDSFNDPEYLGKQLELFKERKGTCRIGISSISFLPLKTVSSPANAKEIIDREKRVVEALCEKGGISRGVQEQYKVLLDSYENGSGGECEVILFPGWLGKGAPEPGKNYVTVLASFNKPFSRGTIHVNSRDAHSQPSVDPHYFEHPIDLETMTETLKFIRELVKLEPFKSLIVREVAPGPTADDDASLQEFLKESIGTTYHTIGTLSMLPRELDGAVDPKLRVYGTQNIRVADLSIVPLHVASHTQSLAYAIGEQAADIIKGFA